jgi:uncharacterized protein YqjF (DUF2071 family)
MIVDQLMAETSHRLWPLPTRPWAMRQSWHDLLFAHWPVPAAELRRLVPPQLQLETFDGNAWVGVVPFRMTNVRPRGTVNVPGLSAFPEMNVRTYVHAPSPTGPRPGVYFFSLDAGNHMAVAAARRFFKLPYYRAEMRLSEREGRIRYASRRTHPGAPPAQFVARYGPTGGIYHSRPGTLESWLTDRYCLYTVDRRGRLYRGEIQHAPWPLQPAAAEIEINTMAAAAGIILPKTPPLLHFARRADMVAWLLTQVRV